MNKQRSIPVLLVLLASCAGCPRKDTVHGIGDTAVVSRAYQGHETDLDMNHLIAVYPDLAGTRLDDCQTCHRAGDVTYPGDTQATTLNACDYCHLLDHAPPVGTTGAPTSMADTLNPYGVDYRNAGRNREALTAIETVDSDGDLYWNRWELEDRRYPGDPASNPSLPPAPTTTFTLAEIKALTAHNQFTLLNANKQQFDVYATYIGVKIIDLLNAAGVDLTNATSVTVFAPDGFSKDYQISPNDEIRVFFPGSYYYDGLGEATLGPDQALVRYPAAGPPAGVNHGAIMPGEKWILLAYEVEGLDLEPAYLDVTTGKIGGEGPLRSIKPAVDTDPNHRKPDRGRFEPTYGDGWDYNNSGDHNAGACVKGVVAIRVNPMPAGFEEFDWKYGGWSLVVDGKLILYGQGVTGN